MSQPQGFAVIPNFLARDADVPAHAKLTYIALTSHAGVQAEAWPTHRTLAAETGLSVSSVQRGLDWLRDGGYVTWEKQQRPDGGQTSNRYHLHIPLTAQARPVVQSDRGGSVTVTDHEEEPSQRTNTSTSSISPSSSSPGITHLANKRKDWQPSPAARARAERDCPDVDLTALTLRFIAWYADHPDRSVSNSAWLQWAAKDQQEIRSRSAVANAKPAAKWYDCG